MMSRSEISFCYERVTADLLIEQIIGLVNEADGDIGDDLGRDLRGGCQHVGDLRGLIADLEQDVFACVDACDDIMDKMRYPRGLIRYATQNGMAQHHDSAQMWRRVLRPRVMIYTSLLGLITLGLLR